MRHQNDSYLPSATDLAHFLGCRHRVALEMQASTGALERPHFDDPILELLFKRGTEHEKNHVASLIADGRNVVDLSHIVQAEPLIDATRHAMRNGADVIVQGALRSGIWYGKPDLLQRVERSSNLGDWSYEVADTKLALETRAGTILQLSLYSTMLAELQGTSPECFYVVTPDATHSYRVDDYAAYFRFVRDTMAETLLRDPAEIAREHYPEPVELCDICTWAVRCREKRRADDHLSLVAGITSIQRRELASNGTTTLTSLSTLALPLPFKPDRGSRASYERVREQARLQVEARSLARPPHELRDIETGQGLSLLPEPSPGDVFLDLEGDHLGVDGGREYLFGVVTLDAHGEPQYDAYWAANDREERQGFEAVMDLIASRMAAHPEMHVYHYAPYEVTAFRRLMGRYATREDELDAMLRAGRFVDLYAVVRQSMIAGIERYSIKNLEPMYDFAREVDLKDAGRNLRRFEYALAIGALDSLPTEVRDSVVGYNRDDCVSTLRLRDWLESLRRDAIANGKDIPRPTLESGEPSAELSERQRRVDLLRSQLLDGREETPPHGTPEHGRFLLAYLLDFHRRESKASWARFFQRCVAPDEDLLDDAEALVELQFVERVSLVLNRRTKKPTGSVIDRYAYPEQEMEIRAGSTLMKRDKKTFGEVDAVDRVARTIDVKKSKAQAEEHPHTAFVHDNVRATALEDSLEDVASAVVSRGRALEGANDVARTLLLAESPRLIDGTFAQPIDDDTCAFAVDVVTRLDRTVLAIQGPPGAGKTYTGARMILAAIAAGKRVGISGPSHKVITNLLMAVVDAAATQGVTVRVGQKAGDDDTATLPAPIVALGNESACATLSNAELDVVGGTAWLWARPEMRGCVDLLFVDEAGQVSLANAIAISGAARSMILLGDPQQLDSPLQGSHPDGVEASALQHLLGAHLTLPPDRGIFLPVTWRLAPSICALTSELFYESRLVSKDGLERQSLANVGELSGNGLWFVDVEHDGNTSASEEEVDAVAALVAKLTAPNASWADRHNATAPLTSADVLVVSPFNAQVSRLAERLRDARVGTVDKFQGQEAPVVIYSMATSRPEDAPRGMEFLYSPNRFNVATSRARCVVIVVANPRLYEPECHSPRQMQLANALCRYREMARLVSS